MASRPLAILTALITSAAALTAALPASAAITCDTATSGGSTFYDGPSASYKYDARFSNSASIPNLSTYTPQGAGTWYNWDGSGKNLILIAACAGVGAVRAAATTVRTMARGRLTMVDLFGCGRKPTRFSE